mmetsp:Transcript_13941/g.48551  ORF Transcript_13941/g.48551 Transcript_13941/m.48551 type:complete len:370 (+) Transcript_13941:333-1442(+)
MAAGAALGLDRRQATGAAALRLPVLLGPLLALRRAALDLVELLVVVEGRGHGAAVLRKHRKQRRAAGGRRLGDRHPHAAAEPHSSAGDALAHLGVLLDCHHVELGRDLLDVVGLDVAGPLQGPRLGRGRSALSGDGALRLLGRQHRVPPERAHETPQLLLDPRAEQVAQLRVRLEVLADEATDLLRRRLVAAASAVDAHATDSRAHGALRGHVRQVHGTRGQRPRAPLAVLVLAANAELVAELGGSHDGGVLQDATDVGDHLLLADQPRRLVVREEFVEPRRPRIGARDAALVQLIHLRRRQAVADGLLEQDAFHVALQAGGVEGLGEAARALPLHLVLGDLVRLEHARRRKRALRLEPGQRILPDQRH